VLVLRPYLTREHAGWYRGTADAVAQNWDVIEESRAKRVLVMPGDHVYKMDYRALAESHSEKGAAVTLAVTPVNASEIGRFGMVTLGEGRRVTSLEEKPRTTESRLASMGVALFETEVLREALRPHPVDLTLDVLRPLIDSGQRVFAHEFAGYWEDVGTLATYYRANMDLLEPEPRLVLDDPRWPILTRDEERPPVLVRAGATLERSLVANGCRIAGRVRNSVLSSGVTVEAGAEVVASVVLADTRVGAGARLDHAILDKYSEVGERAVVGDGGVARYGLRPELTLVGKYARIPAGARVGRGAVLGIGAQSDDFEDNRVAAGARVPDRHELAARP
jgi:glucose-1-phosphate adenylyltransferase